MLPILNRRNRFGRLAQTLAAGLVALVLAFLAACADFQGPQASVGEAPEQALPAIQVVTTTNFVADWVRVVGGNRVEVFSLLPVGGDPHHFQPTPRDIAKVADADLVLSIGLYLEAAWLEDLLHNASADESKIVALGEFVDPIEFTEVAMHDDHEDEHEHEGEHHDEMLIGRLLIGDGEEGKVSLIDLETGAAYQNRFSLDSRAGLIYTTENGRFAIAVSTNANTARVFDGGIFLEAHGVDFDLVESDTSQLSLDLSGDSPVNVHIGDDWAAIFYAGSGEVVLLDLHELEEHGDSYVPLRMDAGPQQGAAVPLEDDLFAVTIKHPDHPGNPDARLPIGAEIRELDGTVLYSAEACDSLQGGTSNGHEAAFGCLGGVLVLEAHDGEYSHAFITPDGVADDFQVTAVWGYHGLDHFFALGSAAGLYIVEPEEERMELLFAATESLRPIQVQLGRGGESLLVVMSDGELRVYDAHDGHLLASKADFLATPVETGFWARPHLAVAPGAIFVTDSVGGAVLQLDEHDLEEIRHWHVAGAPTKIAFVGIVGEAEDHHGHDDGHGHDGHAHGTYDPHFWFDPIRVKIAINEIAARLAAIDPDNANVYYQNVVEYEEKLDELHAWIQDQVSAVEPERRLLVTSHDSLSYLAKLYGFEVVGLVIPSLSTHVEPSAEHIAELVDVIREHDVPALFGETTVSDRLAQAVARETGAELVQLYSGSLGPEGSGADTYLGMVRANVTRIVEALK